VHFNSGSLKAVAAGDICSFEDRCFEAGFKDLKLAFFSAAVTSAGLSQPGAFGYRAVAAIAASLLSASGRAIWRSLLRTEHDGSQFKILRDMRAAGRRSKGTFNPSLLLADWRMALSSKTSTNQEHRHA
jgi:hypothetical protein